MNEFALFMKFNNLIHANELANEFGNNGIECHLINNSPAIDITFSANTAQQNEFQLMVKQSDFEKANNLLNDKAEQLLKDINKDHYLFEFTDEELYEILLKPDEWNAFDYKLALIILRDRDQIINDDLLKSLIKEEGIKTK